MTTATIIPSLTNNPPSRANPAAFPTDGDSFLNDLPGVVSGVNTVATELNTWNAEVETFKNQANSSQTNAANSSATSLTQARNAAASMVSLWVSGTTYPAGQIVYSNVNGREYKRKTAGAGTTDPSSDTANWEPLGWEYITNYPDIRPTLDLNFAGSQTVDPRITFTRNSTATYFDKFGVMQTAGINQPRIDFNPATGECKGLLIEESRTNVLLNSATLSTQNVTTTAVAYTLSFYGTGSVTLSGASSGVLSGTGASDRVSVTFTPTDGTLTLTVSGTVTNAQLEVGSFPTSYIPTTSSSVTRQADNASMTGSNFTSWYRQDEGTVFAEYTPIRASNGVIVGLDSSGTRRFLIYDGTDSLSQSYYVGATSSVALGSVVDGSSAKVAVAFDLNGSSGSLNSGSIATSAQGIQPANRLSIGSENNSSIRPNSTIKKITYYPKRLPNQVLQAITQP